MANVESSWQSSVFKLAQAGNLRAIAFWINRYLVPQGICAQVVSDKPGHLLIRVVCHQAPDGDRLVRFICQRLASLHSEMIRTVRITAQQVGSSNLLWDKSAHIQDFASGSDAIEPLAPLHPAAHAAPPSPPAPPVVPTILQAQPHRPVAVPPAPQPHPGFSPSETVSNVLKLPFEPDATPPRRPIIKRRLPLWKRWSRQTIRQAILLPHQVRQVTLHSVEWFNNQTLPIRAVALSGSALAVFLIGCGFEVLRQYTIDPNLGRSASRILPMHKEPGVVQTALEEVPVIPIKAANLDDPTVTLLFSNSAALSQVPESQLSQARFDLSDPSSIDRIALDRQADLIMTSLDNPLTLPQVMSRSTSSSESEDSEEVSPAFPIPEQTIAPEASESKDKGETKDEDEDEDDENLRTDYRLPKTTVQELLANRVDVVAVAEPQPAQAKTAELVQTLDVLQRSQIHAIGAGQDEREARRPLIFDVKDQRIAYLGYSEPSLSASLAAMAGITPTLASQINEDIRAIREQVDWVIVNFRWQRSLRAYPENWQIELSHLAIDQGADLVVGYHPDLTQGAEVYQGRGIIYSIGSSVDEYVDEYSSEDMPDRDTVSLKVTLQDEKMKVELLPIQIRQGQSTAADQETGEAILDYVNQASSFFEQPMRPTTVLDARVRMSLPTAPDADLPTDPFLSYPDLEEE
ncbi:MAG: hypothetical protein Kow00121_49750 [Elainellaceae cyanobacterium]